MPHSSGRDARGRSRLALVLPRLPEAGPGVQTSTRGRCVTARARDEATNQAGTDYPRGAPATSRSVLVSIVSPDGPTCTREVWWPACLGPSWRGGATGARRPHPPRGISHHREVRPEEGRRVVPRERQLQLLRESRPHGATPRRPLDPLETATLVLTGGISPCEMIDRRPPTWPYAPGPMLGWGPPQGQAHAPWMRRTPMRLDGLTDCPRRPAASPRT